MNNKLKIVLSLALLLIVLTPIHFANANNDVTIKYNNTTIDTVTVNETTQSELEIFDFSRYTYDETNISEFDDIKIGEGYTSDGIFYEAFKPNIENWEIP